MDPDTAYVNLVHTVERLAARPDMSGNDETLVESWRALDGWLARGGYRPAAWSTHDRTRPTANDEPLVGPEAVEYGTRRLRPVRRDDATHPRELPDEETFVEATEGLERQARRGTPEAIAAIEAVEHELRPAGWPEPSTYEDPAVRRAIAETIARGDA